MNVSKKNIAKYTMLPGVLPRAFALFTSGFAHTAYLIAIIYQSLRLLPAAHPYVNPVNIGRFGIRHVIAEAANNLVFTKHNIDQILIFFVILIGMALIFAQFALLAVAVISQPVLAAGAIPEDGRAILTLENVFGIDSFFSPKMGDDRNPLPPGAFAADHPAQDLAFIILDRVFGVQSSATSAYPGGFFGSCVGNTAVDCLNLNGRVVPSPGVYPMPFHLALHSLLRFYSLGIFIVSVFVILYFVVSITAETAATGTPFGQRFNKAWAPVRLILFFALLVPLNVGDGKNEGLNSAQMITFWTAKVGSNFATNAWGRFNIMLTESFKASGTQGSSLGETNTLVATPNVPQLNELTQFIFTAMACKIAQETAYEDRAEHINEAGETIPGIGPYLVRREEDSVRFDPDGPNHRDFLSTSYEDARLFSNNGTITVSIGVYRPDDDTAKDYIGAVIPDCGIVKFKVPSVDEDDAPQSGADALQDLYYTEVLQRMMSDTDMYARAQCIVNRTYQRDLDPDCNILADNDYTSLVLERYKDIIQVNLPPIIQLQIDNGDWDVNDALEAKGWAGAALWYNRIAEMNGTIADTVSNVPVISDYPMLLEYIKLVKTLNNEDVPGRALFDPVFDNAEKMVFKGDADAQIAPAMFAAFAIWTDTDNTTSNNFLVTIINKLFGTSGMFEMRKNTDIHPLAQLSTLGKSMMEASIRNLASGLPLSFLKNVKEDPLLSAFGIGGEFLTKMGTTTLAMSFVLYYVLPFLPFIYFIFAVSGWVKSIFEAVVAMPLWALAHISRIDGEGIPGPAATNGYFLLLEIFLRPILILFGLVASIFIFSALVKVLNDGVFDLVISNLGGVDRSTATGPGVIAEITMFARGPIDQFFFTAMYVIIVYMMGLASFKLIDLIPNNILRWAGVTVSTFQEGAGDPASQVIQKTYSGALLATNQVKGGALAALAS